MKQRKLAQVRAQKIKNFGSCAADAAHLASGNGEMHLYLLRFGAGGEIGEHETGFAQILVVLQGSGWVEEAGHRKEIACGDVIQFSRGVMHAKGSKKGMTVLMLQCSELSSRLTVQKM
jgi:quercetin dioxygenase-like cupin family protein